MLDPGDIVVLASGGPDMTVMEVNGGLVTCWWVGEDGVTDQGVFPIDSLVEQ